MQQVMIAMLGLPRSGKSTRAKELSLALSAPIVCPDDVRLTLHGQAFYPSAEPMVWGVVNTMISTLFRTGHQYIIVDACNRRRKYRDELRYCLPAGAEIRFEAMRVSKDICLSRTDAPGLREVIERMAQGWEAPGEDERPFSLDEFGNPRDALVQKWMDDELADMKVLSEHCSFIYRHASGGRISKPMTLPSEVISIHDELWELKEDY